MPEVTSNKIKKIERYLNYQYYWPGYYIAETLLNFAYTKKKYRLITQRECERQEDYV